MGNLKLKNPDISIGAAIRATVSGVKLEASMHGCWYNAFGSRYLSICNLFFSLTIPFTGLEFGGSVEIRKQLCNLCWY